MSDQTHTATASYRRLLIVVALAVSFFGALIGALGTTESVRAAFTPANVAGIIPPYTPDYTATGTDHRRPVRV